jgi:hypothetical protein
MWELRLYTKSNYLKILRPCWDVSGYIPVLITGRYQSLILRTVRLLRTTKTSSIIHEWKIENEIIHENQPSCMKFMKIFILPMAIIPHKHLAKFGYKPFMKYKLYNQPFIFMKTKYKNLAFIYLFIFSLWVWLKPSKITSFYFF